MKILVTGKSPGFVGGPLLRALKAEGLDARAGELELLDPESIRREIEAVRPWIVVHLAGLSHVPTCEKDPERAMKINRDGTRLIAEALAGTAGSGPAPRMIFASSSQVYAAPKGDEVSGGAIFTETRRTEPQNLYARTKWEAEEALREVAAGKKLDLTILRFFNHTHKSQSPDFFLPHIYQELKAGKKEIPVGNLDVYRDLGALEDLITALMIVIGNSPESQVYNICSGRAKKLRTLAEGLAEKMGVKARFVTDPARVRSGEPVSLTGSHERLTNETGWQPTYVTESELLESFLR